MPGKEAEDMVVQIQSHPKQLADRNSEQTFDAVAIAGSAEKRQVTVLPYLPCVMIWMSSGEQQQP